MNDRLAKYRYPVRPVNWLDALGVGGAILLPFKCELRFLNPLHVWTTMRSGTSVMRLQLLLTPLYYLRRIKLCYQYYWRTLNGIQFSGKWVQVEGRDYSA